jgi:hypothetical protein
VRLALLVAATAAAALIAGCQAIGPLFGAGVGAAVNKEERDELREEQKKQATEVAETFTQPLARTKSAALTALKRMSIPVTSAKGGLIVGKTKEHQVEIQLTPVTEKATRMSVKVGEGDKATAQEIVKQTQRTLSAASKAN